MARLPKQCNELLAQVRDELERIVLETRYLEGVPFSWVTVVLRFGLHDQTDPEFGRIDKKYGDLPLSIELDISPLQGASTEMHRVAYLRATAKALVGAGKKYGRPTELLERLASGQFLDNGNADV
jgi:hypothetical protein